LRPRAATLAVGTEVTDGQILDRNSAWISERIAKVGFEVIEHRAVPDDRVRMADALRELAMRVDFLFVTGGLGPTSDDFTREVLADVFGRPLMLDESSWQRVQDKLVSRGVTPKEIQKQQCFFPTGSRLIDNPAGTAEGFAFDGTLTAGGKSVAVYVLPGPPSEVAAVWQNGMAKEIEAVVPADHRDALVILRTLGKAESEVAEIAEPLVTDTPLKVGYRAHMPYVEVKLWYREDEAAKTLPRIETIAGELRPWLVNRDAEDVADPLVALLETGARVRIHDRATQGILQTRLFERLQARDLKGVDLTIQTEHRLHSPTAVPPESGWSVEISGDEASRTWKISLKSPQGARHELEAKPAYNYNLSSERGRRFIAEKALHLLGPHLR
jgi:molybdenum cofactor synthesis domain-containing protein